MLATIEDIVLDSTARDDCPYRAKSRPVGNVSDSAILEAGMVTALGPLLQYYYREAA